MCPHYNLFHHPYSYQVCKRLFPGNFQVVLIMPWFIGCNITIVFAGRNSKVIACRLSIVPWLRQFSIRTHSFAFLWTFDQAGGQTIRRQLPSQACLLLLFMQPLGTTLWKHRGFAHFPGISKGSLFSPFTLAPNSNVTCFFFVYILMRFRPV